MYQGLHCSFVVGRPDLRYCVIHPTFNLITPPEKILQVYNTLVTLVTRVYAPLLGGTPGDDLIAFEIMLKACIKRLCSVLPVHFQRIYYHGTSCFSDWSISDFRSYTGKLSSRFKAESIQIKMNRNF